MKAIWEKIILIILATQALSSHAQLQDSYWFFGDSAGLHFVNDTVNSLQYGGLTSDEACASISDVSGDLLFYTNGLRVWDRTHAQMPNGFGLMAYFEWNPEYGSTITNGVLILPNTYQSSQYYIFTVSVIDTQGLSMSIVDMGLNGGYGDIGFVKNQRIVQDTLAEKLSAVRHGNGRDWWIVTKEGPHPSGRFYLALITEFGASFIDTIQVGPAYFGFAPTPMAGEMTFSANGEMLASVSSPGVIELYDFDRCSGTLSFRQNLVIPSQGPDAGDYYGCEFSGDGSKLYVTTWDTLFQFDLASPDILASKLVIGSTSNPDFVFGQLQRGIDNKIYIAHEYKWNPSDTFCIYNQNLSVVNFPNLQGFGCGFQPQGLSVENHRSFLGLPNNPNYALGPFVGSPCDTLGVGVKEPEKVDVQIHPNPNSGLFTLEFEPHGRDIRSCSIRDMTGRVIFQETTPPGQFRMEIDIVRFVDGVYFVELSGDAGTVYRSKVVVQK